MAEDPPLPRTERPDAPLYLASYLRRRARQATPEADSDAPRPTATRRCTCAGSGSDGPTPTRPTRPRRSGTASPWR